jgi:hypothetical protein
MQTDPNQGDHCSDRASLLLWVVAWIGLAAIDGRRSYIGHSGFSEWTAKAQRFPLSSHDRAVSTANAAFELDVAVKADQQQRLALAVGSGGLAAGLLFLRLRRRSPRPAP